MKQEQKSWTQTLAKSWDRWTPPDRPSPGELKVYEKTLIEILRKNKKPKVMVLGSTSEFRDLYAKYKLPCTVVDYSEQTYQALSWLMKRKKIKETLVTEDWRTYKPKEKYDLILGDYCFNVIPKADQPKFIGNVAKMLKPDGRCMIKTFVRYDEKRGDLAERLRFYRTKMKHRPILETVMATMFKSVYDYNKEVTLFPDIWKKFLKLNKKGLMKDSELAYFRPLNFQNIPLKVYIPHIKDILDYLDSYASLVGIRFGGEWFSKDVPILIFGKKK